ncbi:uncharacterized protein DS421_16g554630 [Arachis hypogaea]|nr:uncharacterized protein DS421_16g554630 [Arachis hypogaea]
MATMKKKAHYNKTHYCRCQTKAISTVYMQMSQEKKDIVEEIGFGALANVPKMNVSNTLLKELLDRFDKEKGCLKTLQGKIYITPRKVAAALGITNGEGEENQKNFKRTFVVFIQKCFLLPTTELKTKERGKKQPVDGCAFVLMLIYFHEIKFPCPFSPDAPPAPTEQAKDNAAERRKRALEMIREKRSKKTNDGAQSANIAPDQFDSPKAQNEFSQTVPTVNLDSEQILQTQGSSTPSVNAREQYQENNPGKHVETRNEFNVFLSLDSLLFITAALKNPKSRVLQCLLRVLPTKEQQQQSKEPPVAHQSEQEASINVRPLEQQEQPCEEPTAQQSEQEAPVNVCPPELEKQDVTVLLTSSIIEEFFKDDDVYEISDEEEQQQSQEPPMAWKSEQETLILSSFDSAAQPRKREDERPSFNFGISPPASQPSQPSQLSVLQLEILEEVVVDAGVTAVLNFAEATTLEPTLPASEVYKTPGKKKKKTTNEFIEKCYHWMTHVKHTKDGSNEYDTIFVLKHEALYEGLREYFMSLMPKEQVHATVVCTYNMILNEIKVWWYQELKYIVPLDIVNFMLGTHSESYVDKSTNKAYQLDIEQYAHHRQFLDKRKLALHPFLFVPICNGAHWWLWIVDVNKKKFYVLDPINKLPENIPDSRKKLNKFVGLIISQMRVYAGRKPLMEDGLGVEVEYILLNGQRTE